MVKSEASVKRKIGSEGLWCAKRGVDVKAFLSLRKDSRASPDSGKIVGLSFLVESISGVAISK